MDETDLDFLDYFERKKNHFIPEIGKTDLDVSSCSRVGKYRFIAEYAINMKISSLVFSRTESFRRLTSNAFVAHRHRLISADLRRSVISW